MAIDEPPRPGDFTQERLVLKAQREADAILNRLQAVVAGFRTGSQDWQAVADLLSQLRFLEADAALAGSILGMLSPWMPVLRDTPQGVPRDVRRLRAREVEPAEMALRTLKDILPPISQADEYRWPQLEDAVRWITGEGIASDQQLADLQRDLQRRAFSESLRADSAVVDRLKAALAESTLKGESLPTFRKRIADVVDLPRAQAETLFRTNTKQAFLAGQQRSLEQPRVRDRFRWELYVSTQDPRTRPTHAFFDGWVCERRTPLHHLFLQLQGEFNCRCTLIPLDQAMAESYGIKTIDDVPASILSQISLSNQAA